MPTNTEQKPKKEKTDHRQVLLDLLHKQSGPMTAVIMDKALKTQDKQIEQAMMEGGMTATQIGQGQGIDPTLLNKLLGNKSSGSSVGTSPKQSTQPEEGTMANPIYDKGGAWSRGGVTKDKDGKWHYQPRGVMNEWMFKGQGGNADAPNLKAMGDMGEMGGLETKDIYGFDPETGEVSLRGTVGKNADIRNMSSVNEKLKEIYGFDPTTGEISKRGEVPGNADVRNIQPSNNLNTLPPSQQLGAYALARKVAGVRGAEKLLPSIVSYLEDGKTLDQAEDEIRMSQQSIGVSAEWRDAAQSILGSKTSETQRNVVLDSLDDYRQKGDEKGAKEYLKNIARESAPVDQQNRAMGKERTVEFLDEIKKDLQTLETNGIKTNWLKGNMEGLMNRAGMTSNPELKKIQTKIAVGIINYRNAMSGVAFGEKESADYKKLFPAIDKVGDFNVAVLDSLKESFSGDLEKFYSLRMGKGNYEKLFPKDGSTGGTGKKENDPKWEKFLKITGRSQ
jgi:hypothetical protein